jgi:hypothetical protein
MYSLIFVPGDLFIEVLEDAEIAILSKEKPRISIR